MSLFWRNRWLCGGFVLTVLTLLVPMPAHLNSEFWERLMDVVHIPFFGLLTFFLHATNPAGLVMPRQRRVAAALLAFILAALTEVVQPYTGREESLIDLRNGIFGIVLAYFTLAALPRIALGRLVALLVATLALTLFALRPVFHEFRGIAWRHSHFPQLADFEDHAELPLWLDHGPNHLGKHESRVTVSAEQSARGAHSLKVVTQTPDFPGVRLRQDGADWRGYAALAFEVFNPGEPFTLGLRIDDQGPVRPQEERYNDALPLARGWNHIRIPLTKIEQLPSGHHFELSHVVRIVFFLDHPPAPHTFYLDDVRLDPQ